MKSKSNRFIIIDSMLIDNDKKELIQVVSSAINRIEVPNSIIKIRESAFAHSKIESIIIPSSVIELEDGLFWNCKNLTEVFLECNIEMLPNSIFAYCESLSSVKMPNGINVIGTGAFSYCRNLQAITLNQNLRVINDSAFFNCENLTFVNIPKTVEIVGNKYGNCFKGCKKLNNLYYDAEKAELAGMPNSIFSLTIGEHVQTLPKRFLSSNDVIETLIVLTPTHPLRNLRYVSSSRTPVVCISIQRNGLESRLFISEKNCRNCLFCCGSLVPVSITVLQPLSLAKAILSR